MDTSGAASHNYAICLAVWAGVPVVSQEWPEPTSVEAIVVLAVVRFAPINPKSFLIVGQIIRVRVERDIPSLSHLRQSLVFILGKGSLGLVGHPDTILSIGTPLHLGSERLPGPGTWLQVIAKTISHFMTKGRNTMLAANPLPVYLAEVHLGRTAR